MLGTWFVGTFTPLGTIMYPMVSSSAASTVVTQEGAVIAEEEAVAAAEAGTVAAEEGTIVAEEGAISEATPRSVSLREQYMGRTPGKGSRTGREVLSRMESEGNLRYNPEGSAEVRYVDPVTKAESWHPIKSTDMGHLVDAVKYWNEIGHFLGPKHPNVRQWMLEPKNYQLQPSSINRSNGARLPDRYMPPPGQE